MIRKIKTSQIIRPRSTGRREQRYTALTLRGRWFENLGFEPGQTVYIQTAPGLVTIKTAPPEPVQTAPLESLKAEFIRLGIPTTRGQK